MAPGLGRCRVGRGLPAEGTASNATACQQQPQCAHLRRASQSSGSGPGWTRQDQDPPAVATQGLLAVARATATLCRRGPIVRAISATSPSVFVVRQFSQGSGGSVCMSVAPSEAAPSGTAHEALAVAGAGAAARELATDPAAIDFDTLFTRTVDVAGLSVPGG
jgi:hypothetical protein